MNMNDSYPSATQVDLFEEGEFVEYTEASVGQRFVNYLVDVVITQFAVGFASGFILGWFLMYTSPDTFDYVFGERSNQLSLYLISLINHLLYYTFCEKVFKGYTLGKLITGTRAIRDDGEQITFKDALLRSLSRIVPFEAFSIWSEGGIWHDRWTKTKVIKTR